MIDDGIFHQICFIKSRMYLCISSHENSSRLTFTCKIAFTVSRFKLRPQRRRSALAFSLAIELERTPTISEEGKWPQCWRSSRRWSSAIDEIGELGVLEADRLRLNGHTVGDRRWRSVLFSRLLFAFYFLFVA